MSLALHAHGKSRVRVGRTWRVGNVHKFIEFEVYSMLESDMAHAFETESNEDMVPTDTQKNCVYYIAKQFTKPCTPEEFAIALAKHLVTEFPRVFAAKVRVEAAPWTRIETPQGPHNHGFTKSGEIRTAYAVYRARGGLVELTAGLRNLSVLKTTQSGYSGFGTDKYTTLGDSDDRIVATVVTSHWRYALPQAPRDFDAAYGKARAALLEAFYGPAHTGVFSPSVQFTLLRMGRGALAAVPEIDSVFLNMPNLHFIPITPVASKPFNNDVYVATSEPHGNIEAVVTRGDAVAPHARL